MVNSQKDGMIDLGACVGSYAERNINLQPQRLLIRLPNAKDVLNVGLKYFMGDSYIWLPEYDEVANWLTDNKGMRLFCMGNCGRGKVTICMQVLPCIMQYYFT